MFLDCKVITRCRQKPQLRKLPRCIPLILWLLVLWLGVFPPQAYAYTDPGSGALLWQALVAGAFGLLFYARKFWYRLFSRRNEQEVTSDPGEDE